MIYGMRGIWGWGWRGGERWIGGFVRGGLLLFLLLWWWFCRSEAFVRWWERGRRGMVKNRLVVSLGIC